LSDATAALSVPVHAAVRPTAATAATAAQVDVPASAPAGALRFAGPTIDTGGRTNGDLLATRMAFEWHARSPRLPEEDGTRPAAFADIQHVGATTHNGWVSFAVATWGAVPAPATGVNVVVAVDVDGDDDPEYTIAPRRLPGS